MRTAFPAAACAIVVAASLIATAGAAAKADRASGAATLQRATWASSTFECTPPYTAPPVNTATQQSCYTAAPNARCLEKSSSPVVVQTCVITQSGSNNDAYVLQDNSTGDSSTTGSTQTQNGTQTVEVTQAGVNNRLDATQTVNQSLRAFGSITQLQDAHQFVTVCQGAGDCHTANTGVNTSKIHQRRAADAHASGGTISQKQDVVAPNGDCDPVMFPSQPNLCADVEQNSSVRNESDLHQESHLRQHASGTLGSAVTQKQQLPAEGLDGHVLQPTSGDAQNKNVAHQHLTDDMTGPPGSSQSQDPELGCCSGQNGNGKSSTNIHQVGILRASELTPLQQFLDIHGDCISSGSCLIVSHGKINGSQATDRCSEQASDPYPATCTTTVFCDFGECTTVIPDVDLASLGFDAMDFEYAIKYVFPLSLPLSPL